MTTYTPAQVTHLLSAEPEARRQTAADYHIPSGAVPVLVAVEAAARDCAFTYRQLHGLRICQSKRLTREYVRELEKRGFIERQVYRRCTRLLPTAQGALVASHYFRGLRAGLGKFG